MTDLIGKIQEKLLKAKKIHAKKPVMTYRSKVYKAVKMRIMVFWVMTSLNLVRRYQQLGGTYRFHLRGIIILL
jgi:hypothetical protein